LFITRKVSIILKKNVFYEYLWYICSVVYYLYIIYVYMDTKLISLKDFCHLCQIWNFS